MKNNLLLGYFGYEDDQIDGQTIKTRLVGEVLSSIDHKKYDFYDTQKIKYFYIRSFIFIFIKVLKAKNIFIMPGRNGLRIIFPLLFIISIFFSKKINYIVVGGWLSIFLEKHFIIKSMLKRINGIYIESKLMKEDLVGKGFQNVEVFYNFRKMEQVTNKIDNKNFKIVFFSRITETKGIYDLLDAFILLNRKDIFLDIYGPIDPYITKQFLYQVKKIENVEYKGVLKDNVYQRLTQYKFMVFPTFYEGEGFPGIIIEAYMSGLPIIASNWKYNFEFIKDNYTGLLYEPRNIQELKNKIKFLIDNQEYLDDLRKNVLGEAEIYSFDHAKSFIEKIIRSSR